MHKLMIPQPILDAYTILSSFTTGGSSAQTLLVLDKNGQKKVLKYASWEGIGSNGIPWLKAQSNRLKQLKEELLYEGAKSIPIVYDQFEEKDLFYYTMEYISNSYPLSLYYFENPQLSTDNFLLDIEKVLSLLSQHFYSQGKLTVPDNYIDFVHIRKIKRKFTLLSTNQGNIYNKYIKGRTFPTTNSTFSDIVSFFQQLLDKHYIFINNKKYINAPYLLNKFENGSKESQDLQPHFLPKYAHGDGTLRNFMRMNNGSIMLIDVRGIDLPNDVPSRICIQYEIAKILRTILLEIVRNDCFSIKTTVLSNGEFHFNFTFDMSNQSVKNFLKVRRKLPGLFKNHKGLQKFLTDENDWLGKTFFAESSHFLADAVNRLDSDSSGKHTLAYYLIGNTLLYDYCMNKNILFVRP